MIVIVFGLPGTGKSYFASRLALKLNAIYIKSDKIRKELLNKRTYSEDEKLSVYGEMLNRLTEAARQNKNAVADATFYKRDIRRNFVAKLPATERILFIEVIADETLIQERLKKDREDSEANFEVYKKVRLEWESMKHPHLVLESTNTNIDEMLEKSIGYLQLKDDSTTNT